MYGIACLHSSGRSANLQSMFNAVTKLFVVLLMVVVAATAHGNDELRPWRWSPYVAVGFGSPSGLRADVGYNVGDYLFAGFSIGRFGMWTRDSAATIGLHGGVRLPNTTNITPYLGVSAGGTFHVLGPSDEYYEVVAGAAMPIVSWIQLRPEFGLFLGRPVVSSSGWFGGHNVVRNNTLYASGRLVLEVDLRPLLWP